MTSSGSGVILVTGANGLTGGELMRRLSAQGVPVRALVRSAARALGLSTLPCVEVVTGDMARPETLTAYAAIFRGEQPAQRV